MTIAGLAASREANGATRELTALAGAKEWLNSTRLTPASLDGKVVLVDFWTYTCINWLRTLPYIRAWAQRYKERLIVLGVHTPEFPFEHNIDNVRRAISQMGIAYPVAIDNDYAIWRAFDNHYWPALYLVDGRGRVRERQFGEGEYERFERAIQRSLPEGGAAGDSSGPVSVDSTKCGGGCRDTTAIATMARNRKSRPAARTSYDAGNGTQQKHVAKSKSCAPERQTRTSLANDSLGPNKKRPRESIKDRSCASVRNRTTRPRERTLNYRMMRFSLSPRTSATGYGSRGSVDWRC